MFDVDLIEVVEVLDCLELILVLLLVVMHEVLSVCWWISQGFFKPLQLHSFSDTILGTGEACTHQFR